MFQQKRTQLCNDQQHNLEGHPTITKMEEETHQLNLISMFHKESNDRDVVLLFVYLIKLWKALRTTISLHRLSSMEKQDRGVYCESSTKNKGKQQANSNSRFLVY